MPLRFLMEVIVRPDTPDGYHQVDRQMKINITKPTEEEARREHIARANFNHLIVTQFCSVQKQETP